jgi:hypothetical protein
MCLYVGVLSFESNGMMRIMCHVRNFVIFILYIY